ncbi:MAG: hypothetical protein Q8O51_02030 [bacterium]|nr:hypothetical protein [bacterium]
MHDLRIWDDDEQPPRPKTINGSVPQEISVPVATSNPEGEFLTFRDICDGTVRTGSVLCTITSGEHTNPYLGHLPAVTLYLVAFENAKRKDDLTVIWQSLIVRPPKPHS